VWKRAFEAIGATASAGDPWYRRPDAWVVVGTVVLPFGWVLALGRLAWAYLESRRTRVD